MRSPAKSNLRASASRFIGRAAELTRLVELLDQGERLITIFGPAGTGKTRLAEAFGARSVAEFAGAGSGGVWMCELAEARSLEALCSGLGRVLSIPPSPTRSANDAISRLGDAIAARGPILLILDNFEQLVDVGASALAAWVAAAPDLHLVVTSREQLRLDGENRLELGPLSLPDGAKAPESSEAVQLFVDRVKRIDPQFTLDPSNSSDVATLVRRLEGIPLAIELAASRVELLGVGGLLQQLDQRLDLLSRGARDGAQRHATLRGAIGWSWDLLDVAERSVLAQCAVFRGGFGAEAATEVLFAGEEHETLSVLQSLREKSLLRKYAAESDNAPPRFSLYESVRAFADEKLGDGAERREVEQRHRDYFLQSTESWADDVVGPAGVEALARLSAETDNLLAIHERALRAVEEGSAKAAVTAVRCVLVLDPAISVRGSIGAHLELLEQTIRDVDMPSLAEELRCKVLRSRGKARMLQGRGASAVRDLDSALALADGRKDHGLQAQILTDLGIVHHQRRETSAARVLYERAVDQARNADSAALEGRVLGNLGALLHDAGRFDEALGYYRDALSLLQEVGDQRTEAIHVANLGILQQERSELAKARAHFDAASELLDELGDRRLLALVAGNRGNLEHEEGNAEEARRCHETALALLREVGDRRSEALCLGRLGRANATLAWIDDARSCLAAADRLLGRYSDPLVAAAVDLDRGFLDVAVARAAKAANDDAAVEEHIASARERIAQASRADSGGDELAWTQKSDDIRTAARILERELSNLAERDSAAPKSRRPALVVGPDGRWIHPPQGDPADLRRRKALRLLLVAFVEHHHNSPGAGLSLDALLAAGWPGERVVPSAGANRVYVALTTLRKLGLRGVLLSQDDGYLLDPALPIERSATDWSSLQG